MNDIEFLRDRIYLGAYDYVPETTSTRVYLTVDDSLVYNNFHHDFGPLNIANLYRFAVILHDVLGRAENKGKALVFYSYTDSRSRANAVALMASYMVLVQSWQPHQVLAPIAQMAPVMPFRDAGYSTADFTLTVQDMVYALWRAKSLGLLDVRAFNLEEYEAHELVENGDINPIGEHFVAFASPVRGNPSFVPLMRYFKKHDVRLVVRLNSHLYDRRDFTNQGIEHFDMIFEDGTCPTMAFVQGFIGAAEGVIQKGGRVAVHCRAGLGRTGCLIGAHLIYSYGFTANEAIAYMRFLRPGMVVGPQQHWLYQHQHEFRDWRLTMALSPLSDPTLGGYSPLVDANYARELARKRQIGTPKASSAYASTATPLGNARRNSSPLTGSPSRNPALADSVGPHTPERRILGTRTPAAINACLPEPTPGQPRKPASPMHLRESLTGSNRRESQAETNSDDEHSQAVEVEVEEEETSSLYGSSAAEEEEDNGTQNQPLVMRSRGPGSRSVSLVSKTTSRSVSGRSSRSSSRRVSRSGSHSPDMENTGVIMPRQRRNITDLGTPSQQMALAKQLRVASNPQPHKRIPKREPEPVESAN